MSKPIKGADVEVKFAGNKFNATFLDDLKIFDCKPSRYDYDYGWGDAYLPLDRASGKALDDLAALSGLSRREAAAAEIMVEANKPKRTVMQEWRDVARSMEVRGPIAMRFSIFEPNYTPIAYIRASIDVDDTENPGTKINLVSDKPIPSYIAERADMIEHIRKTVIHWFFVHEANERIYVNGERTHVPHHEHSRR